MSSSSVTPLSFEYCRWKVSCSALPPVVSAATVIRLRARGDRCGRSHASPNSTSSVKCTRPGAKSPNIFSAPEGSVFWSSAIEGLLSVVVGQLDASPRRGDAVAVGVRAEGRLPGCGAVRCGDARHDLEETADPA